jgi:arylsulfatase
MSNSRPNIILITSDQQRYDTVGPAAPPFLRTPHFDLLCREGVRFSRAYADCPVCVPARVSMMTGKTALRHGLTRNAPTSSVMGRDETLPACLSRAGYQTAAIGKMHFGPQRTRHGFDEMVLPDDYYREMQRRDLAWQPMRHGLGQNELYAAMSTTPEPLTLTSWIAEQAVTYILERRDPTIPFFLWISFTKPHPPLDPPEPYFSMYRDEEIPARVLAGWSDGEGCPEVIVRLRQRESYDLLSPEVIRAARVAYYGLITQIDYNVGRVLAALQDVGLLEEAFIVWGSDHGEFLGDHRCGGKVFFHEPAARIPLVLRMPKSWDDRRHGEECDRLATHADLLPTFAAAAGGRVPDGVDGMDLAAVARGRRAARPFLEGTASGPAAPDGWPYYLAITDGSWKYIWYPEGPAEHLFDLDQDPEERFNLAGVAEHVARRDELRAELLRRQQERDAPWLHDGALPARSSLDDSARDRRNRAWPGFHTERHPVDVRH